MGPQPHELDHHSYTIRYFTLYTRLSSVPCDNIPQRVPQASTISAGPKVRDTKDSYTHITLGYIRVRPPQLSKQKHRHNRRHPRVHPLYPQPALRPSPVRHHHPTDNHARKELPRITHGNRQTTPTAASISKPHTSVR